MGRPSEKEGMIVSTIREGVISGRLAPGSHLASYGILEQDFGASRMTLHRAIGKLKEEGFLDSLERKGVFVSAKPPHLNRIALMMAMPGRKNRFCACLEEAARELAEADGRELVVLTNFSESHCKTAEFGRLRNEIATRMFAGMMVAFEPDKSSCPEIFNNSIPKVYFNRVRREEGIKLDLDSDSFARKVLERLKGRGATRIAILSYPHVNFNMESAVRLLDGYGLRSKPEWQIGMDNPEIAGSLTRLIFSSPSGERPDGLLLTDDHLAEHAAKGVIEAGLRVPEDLKVVSHCNWTLPPPRPFPMELLGYDSRQLMRLAVDSIDAANAGRGSSTKGIRIEPLFEEELERTSSARPFAASFR